MPTNVPLNVLTPTVQKKRKYMKLICDQIIIGTPIRSIREDALE